MYFKTILFFILLIFSKTVYGEFYINEIFPNSEDDTVYEYFSIKNNSSENLDLNGYKIIDKALKEYTFLDEDIFSPEEERLFYREKTKILLNNSNEELYLYDSQGVEVFNYNYSTTNKGEVYTIEPYNYNEDSSTEIILEEELTQEDTSSGTTEESTQEVFFIKFDFQNPSYIEEKNTDFGTGEINLNCDKDYDECKINFDFRNSFNDTYKESDYYCEIIFGSGLIFLEEDKCNPNTVIYELGSYTGTVNVYNKNDNSLFSSKDFYITNNEKTINNESLNLTTENTISKLFIPKPIVEVQSGLNQKYSKVYRYYYICDKKVCKINLKYDKLYDNVECNWNFKGGIYDDKTREKCNPGYVDYEPGLYEIKLRVCQEELNSNCKSTSIFIENIFKPEKNTPIIGLQNNSENIKNVGDTIVCESSQICKLNFIGDYSLGEDLSYEWYLFDNLVYTGSNPPYMDFDLGKSNLTLKTIDENLIEKEKNITIEVYTGKVLASYLENKILESDNLFSLDKNLLIIKNKYKQINSIEDYVFQNIDIENKIRINKNSFSIYGNTFTGSLVNIKRYKKGLFDKYIFLDEFTLYSDDSGDYKFNMDYDFAGDFKIETIFYDNYGVLYDYEKFINYYSIGEEYFFEKEVIAEYKESLKNISKKEKVDDFQFMENIDFDIIVQGKIGKNKVLNGSKITCLDTCSINFGLDIKSGKNANYNWDFGNGEYYEGINPGYMKYNNFGNYILKVKAFYDEDDFIEKEFYISFIKKHKQEIIKDIKEENNISNKKVDEKNENKKDYGNYFILFIILLSLFLSFLLLKRYRVI